MTTSRRSRRLSQIGLGLGLSGLFLYLALEGEDWDKVAAELVGADYLYLLAMVPLGIYILYVRCQRWQILLERAAGVPCPMGPVFSASAIGFMANMVLPLRVGEFARPYLVSRHSEVSLTTALATVVVERVLDLLVLFVFAAGVLLFSEVPPLIHRLTWIAGVIAVALAAGSYLVAVQRDRFLPHLDALWARLPESVGRPILRLEHEFLDGIATIGEIGVLARTLVLSFYVWLLIAFGFSLGFWATGIDVPFFGGGITVATLVALAVSIPSAPAFVGQFEWGCKLALEQVYGVRGELAVGYSLLVHVTQFLTQVGLGLVFLVREGLSLREVSGLQAESGEGD